MPPTNWQNFRLLLWKNWLLQVRHRTQTTFEILIPVAFCALLVLLRVMIVPTKYTKPIVFDALELTKETLPIGNSLYQPRLSYSPKNPVYDRLVQIVAQVAGLSVEALSNAKDLEEHLVKNLDFAGIEFPDSSAHITKLPDHLDFAIRFPSELRLESTEINPLVNNWQTNNLFPIYLGVGPRKPDDIDGGVPSGYFSQGFLHLQHAMFGAFFGMKAGSNISLPVPEVLLRRLPYPPYITDGLMEGMKAIFTLIFLMSFTFPCCMNVKFLTIEKEKQLKETMKIMGLCNWLNWAAWFTKCLQCLTITVTLMVILLKIVWSPSTDASIFRCSNSLILWIFLMIFGISTIMFSFMISTFFSKTQHATPVAATLYIFTYVPYTFLARRLDTVTLAPRLLTCLFSNSAMAFGAEIFAHRESMFEGVQWSNVNEPIKGQLHLGHVLGMLIFDSILYFLIALYVEQIRPGDYGVPNIWYYPLTMRYWCGEMWQGDDSHPSSSETKVGIEIMGLTKVFSKEKIAVSNLNLKIYENQITVLLGHNGAGKSTTMSMLTGMLPPTSGTALINGCNIRTNIQGVRASIGLCPQQNNLFDELTVREHIVFYSCLKGLGLVEVEQEVQKYATALNIVDKLDVKSQYLSGGMQRKLSAAVALCAGSKVVLFDEPTSGIDPAARRDLWNLLTSEKKGRTILLSTHSMDEADVLADSIAILAGGKLKAVGSPFALKQQHGGSTRIVCIKAPGCDIELTTQRLHNYDPELKLLSHTSSEFSYEMQDQSFKKLQAMMQDLEDNMAKLKILNFGVVPTSMRDIFMKIGSDSPQTSRYLNIDDTNGENAHEMTKLKGTQLIMSQIRALFRKYLITTVRNWRQMVLQNLFPIVLVLLTVGLVRSYRSYNYLPPLNLELTLYNPTITILQSNPDEGDVTLLRISKAYREAFPACKWDEVLVDTTEDLIPFVLDEAQKSRTKIDSQFMVAASMTNQTVTAWFNNRGLHTAPISLNLVHNAILGAVLNPHLKMTVTNKPLPFRLESQFFSLEADNNMGFQLSFNLSLAMAFVLPFFITWAIKERVTKVKMMQSICGLNIFSYWITAFIWDMLKFTVTCLITMSLLFFYQEPGWETPVDFGRVLLILVCLGLVTLPTLYVASNIFSSPATGYIASCMFFLFSGPALYTIITRLLIDNFFIEETGETLREIFTDILPFFAFSDAIHNLHWVNLVNKVCHMQCSRVSQCANIRDLCVVSAFTPCCSKTEFLDSKPPGVSPNLVGMVIGAIIQIIILALISVRHYKISICGSRPSKASVLPSQKMDDDVVAEALYVEKLARDGLSDQNLVLKDVSKFYGNFRAVDKLNIAVHGNECFGLLGINGAGKTSTFKMLVGDSRISSGDAWVRGLSLKSDTKAVHGKIGYCPQFDALIDDLTGRETLEFFCALRGIARKDVPNVVAKLTDDLNIGKHIDNQVRVYSGGNKRKLSTAVALVGDPVVVFLDEPTTGMDPGARRQLWDVISRFRSGGRSIVLTSHNMEECEVLCTRLAIMVAGQFKCLGSVQYLKSKFSTNYVVNVKILHKDESVIIRAFPKAVIKDKFQTFVTFHIPTQDFKWSQIFAAMETLKVNSDIEDYTIRQTSLEQVFLSFVGKNAEEITHL